MRFSWFISSSYSRFNSFAHSAASVAQTKENSFNIFCGFVYCAFFCVCYASSSYRSLSIVVATLRLACLVGNIISNVCIVWNIALLYIFSLCIVASYTLFKNPQPKRTTTYSHNALHTRNGSRRDQVRLFASIRDSISLLVLHISY